MNNQEVFNRAWDHHVVEGQPLGFDTQSDMCTYWSGDDGVIRRCSIGAALPDEIAKKLWDLQVGIQDLIQQVPEVVDQFAKSGLTFLTELQDTHDKEARRQDEEDKGRVDIELGLERGIEARYRDLADGWNLTIPGEEGTTDARPAL